MEFVSLLKEPREGIRAVAGNLDKGKKVDDWNGISIRLPENLAGYKYNNALNFVFDIWPYQPWDIGL